MSRTRVLLVTDELYPFTAGGIGRIVHNLLVDSLAQRPDIELHVLMPPYVKVTTQQVGLYFQDRVRLHFATYRQSDELAADAHGLYPPASAFTDARWHAESLDVLLSLKRLEQEGLRFDVIEFPDFRGLAFCALQEKRLGLAFADTELTVRLHSTYGVLMHFEPTTPEMENLGRFEIERKALLDADRIIAHLPQIAEFNQRYYGFPASWMEKVTVEFPPVVLGAPAERSTLPPGAVRNLVFVTKIQPIKQPELFVRAAATLLMQRPDYTGRVVLSCHSFDAQYHEQVRQLVPESLRERFIFSKPGPDRDALIRDGIVVVPSVFESLNLTAYEASVAGAVLIVNGGCPAFGERTPFIDGVNCLKFDGSVEGLVGAMARAIDGAVLEPVKWTVTRPFWETPGAKVERAPAAGPEPLVSVCITLRDQGRDLPEMLASIAASTHPEVEVVVVDDASTAPYDRVLFERLEREARDGKSPVRLIRNPVHRGRAASHNIGVRAARGRYVLLLDVGDCVAPDFLSLAVRALERHPELVGVVPTVGCFDSDEELSARRFCEHAVFLGDTPSLTLVDDHVSPATLLVRRESLLAHPFDEALEAHEHWELHLRWAHAGLRFLVTNQVHVFHRLVPESGRGSADSRRHFELLTRMYERLPSPLPASLRLSLVLTPLALSQRASLQADMDAALAASAAERPLRYNFVDALNHAVKQIPLVHPLLKQAASVARTRTGPEGEQVPLRYEVADRFNRMLKQFSPLHVVLKRVAEKSVTEES
jgi:GT2 family glycosyltransferase/glycosyltransferase involved in cell wall biosynthesis